MKMVEIIAQAIRDEVGAPDSDGRYHLDFSEMAAAALKAMREPTEAMMAAGIETGLFPYETVNITDRYPEGVWRAMIDAAIEEATQ